MALKTCRACTKRISESDDSCSNALDVASSQLFPSRGVLARNLDTPLAVLRQTIPSILQQRPVFVYIVTSVKVRNGEFVQIGSGPNFQGGYISLCTCKHKDRASPPRQNCRGPERSNPWKGVWVAGLCSPNQVRPRGLFYLMLVGQTFESHTACWHRLSARQQSQPTGIHSVTYMNLFRVLMMRRGQQQVTWLTCRGIVTIRRAARWISGSAITDGIRDCWLAIPREVFCGRLRTSIFALPRMTIGKARTIDSFRDSAVSFRRSAEY